MKTLAVTSLVLQLTEKPLSTLEEQIVTAIKSDITSIEREGLIDLENMAAVLQPLQQLLEVIQRSATHPFQYPELRQQLSLLIATIRAHQHESLHLQAKPAKTALRRLGETLYVEDFLEKRVAIPFKRRADEAISGPKPKREKIKFIVEMALLERIAKGHSQDSPPPADESLNEEEQKSGHTP